MSAHRPADYRCPAEHRHGDTLTCATAHGCTCPDCKGAHREYSFYRRHMLAAGRAHVFDSLIDATAARRRVQALMCLGWSQSEISRRTGIRQARLSAVLYQPTIKTSTHQRIARAYDDLCLSTPPADTKGQRMSVHRTQALAARRGWVPPLAWDDIDNDPTRRPSTQPTRPRTRSPSTSRSPATPCPSPRSIAVNASASSTPSTGPTAASPTASAAQNAPSNASATSSDSPPGTSTSRSPGEPHEHPHRRHRRH
ncbi:helix-turn-helix domain-containing protein [Microbacterium sp. NIBRBAC000506063]|uniref:helix-turn-helix domain-containing protein n=1 Tax=Microbacterium sp. NIBRBAC000506063 TaxID=2734618 RepID=UPI001BB74247|nr:helix-turn-helix transcriptional regulator [Microbacterium sp. NIBRBAC000506063]QTV79452.1 hypothetical protein KAE78_11150 [Microbacterium sp. NIBRBAC000506063]